MIRKAYGNKYMREKLLKERFGRFKTGGISVSLTRVILHRFDYPKICKVREIKDSCSLTVKMI